MEEAEEKVTVYRYTCSRCMKLDTSQKPPPSGPKLCRECAKELYGEEG